MKSDIKIGSNKSFGIVFFLVFLIIGIYPILKGNDPNYWSIIISVIFLILGLFNSIYLTPFNKLWFKFGILLGQIISPIVMGIIFFIVVTPIALFMKILNKDVLNLNKNNKKTYWIEYKNKSSKMKNQF